jgi:hypothetical protein
MRHRRTDEEMRDAAHEDAAHEEGNAAHGDRDDGTRAHETATGSGTGTETETENETETETVVREQLAVIASLLASEAPDGPAAAPLSRPRRTPRVLVAAGLGLAAAASALTLLAAPPLTGGEDAKPTRDGLVACARLIAEGTVARTGPGDDGSLRVVLTVRRRLVPAGGNGPPEEEFSVPRGEARSFGPGTRMLVLVSRFPREPVLEFTGPDIAPTWEWMAAEAAADPRPSCAGPA